MERADVRLHMHLARGFGFWHLEDFYEVATAQDLLRWETLYALDPWGEYRADLRNGLNCSLMDACHRSKGKPATPLEYMPIVQGLEKPKPRQSEEQMKAIIGTAFANWDKKHG